MPHTYQRIVVARYGGPGVLQVSEDTIPEPQTDEVRVRILAAGVAWGDVLKREGVVPIAPRLPFTPGYDLAGVIDQLGDGVSSLKVGQKVAALPMIGGYAEFISLPATELTPIPTGIDPAEAVSLVLNYITAYQLLHRVARVKPRDRILIHGAAGGVGTALLELGKLADLEMYGTASAGKHIHVSGLGGVPIDYAREDFVERILTLTEDGVDVALDPIGGSHVWRSYRALRKGGKLVNYGIHSITSESKLNVLGGYLSSVLLNAIPDRRKVRFYNIRRPTYSKLEWCREDLAKLLNLLAQRKIKPLIAGRLPLREAARAHELLEAAAVSGKLILSCSE